MTKNSDMKTPTKNDQRKMIKSISEILLNEY
jgi:hypothetical protein